MTDREQFEAFEYNERGERNFSRDEDGDYCVPSVQIDWQVWQAARAAPAQPRYVLCGRCPHPVGCIGQCERAAPAQPAYPFTTMTPGSLTDCDLEEDD
jgi:hypothetical protein